MPKFALLVTPHAFPPCPPQPIDLATLAQAVQQLLGRVVLQAPINDPRVAIFTLWLAPAPTADQSPAPCGLNVHCAWRTVEAGRILRTSQEAVEGYTGPALQALMGLQIAAATLSEFGDLAISFTGGRALHLWNDAPYEDGDSWLLSFPGQGEYAVAMRNEFTYSPENLHSI